MIDIQDIFSGKMNDELKKARKQINESSKDLNALHSKIMQNKGKYPDKNLDDLDAQMNRVKELKKELDGYKNSK